MSYLYAAVNAVLRVHVLTAAAILFVSGTSKLLALAAAVVISACAVAGSVVSPHESLLAAQQHAADSGVDALHRGAVARLAHLL